MKISRLLKVGQKSLVQTALVNKIKPHQKNAGFTLVELLILLLIVGILSAIAAPGWLAFINNQRLRTSQSRIFGAMQLAQSFAKRDKVAWQASFRFPGKDKNGAIIQVVQWAIHPTTVSPASLLVSTSTSSAPYVWYSLEDKISIVDSLTFAKNLDQVDPTTNQKQTGSKVYRAIFNRQGCIVENAEDECTDGTIWFGEKKLIILQHADLGPARKCAVVETLLGAMRTGDDAGSCD